MNQQMEIRKIRKSGVQKIITIPQKSEMEIGDFVGVIKIDKDKILSEVAQ